MEAYSPVAIVIHKVHTESNNVTQDRAAYYVHSETSWKDREWLEDVWDAVVAKIVSE